MAQIPFHVRSEDGDAFDIGGVTTIIKVRGEATGGALSMVEHSLPAGYLGVPPHRHTFEDETSYVIEGQLKVQLEETVITVRSGEFVFKPRGGFHAFWNGGNEPVRFLDVITPGGFETYFESLALLLPPDGLPDFDAILALAEKYGVEFDVARMELFTQQHGLKPP